MTLSPRGAAATRRRTPPSLLSPLTAHHSLLKLPMGAEREASAC